MLKVGKLYCFRENPLPFCDDKGRRLGWIDTSSPFLVIEAESFNIAEVETTFYQVLYEDKKGWIDLRSGNPVVKEFV